MQLGTLAVVLTTAARSTVERIFLAVIVQSPSSEKLEGLKQAVSREAERREQPVDENAIQLLYHRTKKPERPASRRSTESDPINWQRKSQTRPSGRAADSHAANAKVRATEQVKAGNLARAQEAQIDTKPTPYSTSTSRSNTPDAASTG